jgi:uncharacterized protein YjbI with pentapeptide repeats
VFIASPSGLEAERRLFQETLREFSEEISSRGLSFAPIGWELTLGGVGRPQELINKDLVTCDYFVLVLGDRWGSAPLAHGTAKFTSGCEEEFNLALECLADSSKPMRQVVVFFKDINKKMLNDPGPQLKQVLEFKRYLEDSKKHLFLSFETIPTFQKQLRRYLAQWASDHKPGPPEHIALLDRGIESWNIWRLSNPSILPNLSRANLRDKYLSGFDLSRANLTDADLSDTDLVGADLSGANLSGGVLARTNLFKANLTGVNLSKTMIIKAHLSQARLENAIFGETVVALTDLSEAIGLDTIRHESNSEMGSSVFTKPGHLLPLQFLRGAGIAEQLITFLPTLSEGGIEFYSCFISYATADQEFVERLFADLQASGVRCWFAPHDMKGGRKIQDQIDQAIRVYDRTLLVLSDASLRSSWVNTEVIKARKREVESQRRVLFPVRLMSFEKLRDWEIFDADSGKDSAREIREYFIPDFSRWKDNDSYREAFGRLLRDLKDKENDLHGNML